MNYFDSQTAAERYKRGRPDFHSNTINRIKDFLQINERLEKALDIACGTGLSTKALLDIAENVWGTDASQQMLDVAVKADKIHYILANAEDQPFNDQEFDLITVCSGVHWFHIEEFLFEANRLLKSKGWLVLYENYFISEMEGVDVFNEWFPNVYLQKFPSPPRNNTYQWTNHNLLSKNFEFIEEQRFKNPVNFNKEQLIQYLGTQSNIIAAVVGGTTYADVESWLQKELRPFFETDASTRTIYFGNWIKFIRRLD